MIFVIIKENLRGKCRILDLSFFFVTVLTFSLSYIKLKGFLVLYLPKCEVATKLYLLINIVIKFFSQVRPFFDKDT